MFDSIKRGFSFLGQALSLARQDFDLVKPSLFGMVAGSLVAIVGAVPIILVALLGGDSQFTQFALYALGALVIFAQYVTAYIFSGMTAILIYHYLTDGDGQLGRAFGVIRRDLLDIISLAAASTIVALITGLLRGNGRRGRSVAGGLAATLIEAVWTTATYFVLPAMVIEDLSLPQALKRATYIIKNNLLVVGVAEIGVRGVVGLVGFLLAALAVAVGGGLFVLLVNVHLILAIVAAVLVVGPAIALITAFSSYVTTAYHTCLFIWARSAEQAQAQGYSAQAAAAPGPLAAVLNR
ncbi:MAG: hypothetical protein IT317_15650 [Anaerolineales bacterium]|nr:hypothetical protein [Anaerolineales bacterium]